MAGVMHVHLHLRLEEARLARVAAKGLLGASHGRRARALRKQVPESAQLPPVNQSHLPVNHSIALGLQGRSHT